MKNPCHIITLLTGLLFTCSISPCFSQIKLTKLDKSSIPKFIQYTGKIQNAVSWQDSLGYNLVITTETDAVPGKNPDDGSEMSLYAWHYFLRDSATKPTWKLYDYIKECPVDMMAKFIKNTFAVTDLDKDGTAEIWMMYKKVCRGDVSPADMRVIMYEGSKKHAMRGTNRVPYDEKNFVGGEYSFDDAFKKAPAAFRKYAQELWKKNINETWE